MARRQIIELAGATKKANFLFCHQEKLKIRHKMIWPFFVELTSQLITKMVMYQRMFLNRNGNSKGMIKKVVRCGNQMALYSLARQTIFKILLCVFGSTHKRRC